MPRRTEKVVGSRYLLFALKRLDTKKMLIITTQSGTRTHFHTKSTLLRKIRAQNYARREREREREREGERERERERGSPAMAAVAQAMMIMLSQGTRDPVRRGKDIVAWKRRRVFSDMKYLLQMLMLHQRPRSRKMVPGTTWPSSVPMLIRVLETLKSVGGQR